MLTNREKTPNLLTFSKEILYGNLILGELLKSFGELLKTYIMILQNALLLRINYRLFNKNSFPVTLFYYTLIILRTPALVLTII